MRARMLQGHVPEEHLEKLHRHLHDTLTEVENRATSLPHAAQHDTKQHGEHDDSQDIRLPSAPLLRHPLIQNLSFQGQNNRQC